VSDARPTWRSIAWQVRARWRWRSRRAWTCRPPPAACSCGPTAWRRAGHRSSAVRRSGDGPEAAGALLAAAWRPPARSRPARRAGAEPHPRRFGRVLGAEVDEKTIRRSPPRRDRGVSYTKGCYTARRRSPACTSAPREPPGPCLLFDPEPPATPLAAGAWSPTSIATWPGDQPRVRARDRRRRRRALDRPRADPAGGRPGSVVRAAGRDARVVDLPFAFPIAAPA